MVFTKRLREGIRRGRIRCSIRIWQSPRVKVGGRYKMDDGHIVVDSIEPIAVADVTYDLARESGFDGVDDLLGVAKHGSGENVYLIRFHYLPPGAWDTPRWSATVNSGASDSTGRFKTGRLAGGRVRAPKAPHRGCRVGDPAARARRRQP